MKTYRILLGASLLAVLGACSSSPTEPRAAAGAGSRTRATTTAAEADTTYARPFSTNATAPDDGNGKIAPLDNGVIGSGSN